MDVKVEGPLVTVRLSKRNLLALLHKLEMEHSSCTLVRLQKDGHELVVTAEPDSTHYGRENRPAGFMSLETEQFIREQSEKEDRSGFQQEGKN